MVIWSQNQKGELETGIGIPQFEGKGLPFIPSIQWLLLSLDRYQEPITIAF